MEDLGYKPHGLSWDVIYLYHAPKCCAEPFPLSRSPNKTVSFPKASTCIWAIVRILQHVYMLCHFMWFLLTVCDIKDMAQLRMPFRGWIFWHWELPQILVSIPTYPNHLLVPMSHGFPVFISWLWQAEWKLWQAMPQTWIWGSSCNFCMSRDVCRMY